jgi:hypothetical protein
VYVGVFESSTQSSSIKRISLSTGGTTGTLCEDTLNEPFIEPLVLANTAIGADLPIGYRKGSLVIATGSGCQTNTQFENGNIVRMVTRPGAAGTVEVFFSGTSGANTLRKFMFDGLEIADGGVVTGHASRGMFLDGTQVGFVSSGGVATSPASGSLINPVSGGSPGVNFDVAVGANSVLISNFDLQSCSYTATTGTFGTCSTPAPGFPSAGPVLGAQGKAVVGLNSGGFNPTRVLEVTTTNSQTPVEAVPITAVLIDPIRSPTGAKVCGTGLGVGYFKALLTSGAGSYFLTAILLDSEGLDGTAPWPRPKHDNANSANIGRPLTPWVCP